MFARGIRNCGPGYVYIDRFCFSLSLSVQRRMCDGYTHTRVRAAATGMYIMYTRSYAVYAALLLRKTQAAARLSLEDSIPKRYLQNVYSLNKRCLCHFPMQPDVKIVRRHFSVARLGQVD